MNKVLSLVCVVLLASCSPSESKLRSKVMKLSNGKGLCSGEQVKAPSGIDYILTAAHCLSLSKDGSIHVTTEEGKELDRKVIAEDPKSDLLLLEGVPNMSGLEIAKSSQPKEHVRTFTHGERHATHKTEGELMETDKIQILIDASLEPLSGCDLPKNEKETVDTFIGAINVCLLSVYETYTTAQVVPGSSGGPVVNDQGQLVGVVSAGDGSFGALVTTGDINSFLANY